MELDDDTIYIEEVAEEDKRVPIIGIYRDNNMVSFSSSVSPVQTARILAGLTNYLLENHIG